MGDAAVLGSIEEIDMDVDDLAVLGEVEEMGTDLSSVWLDIAGAKLGTADGNDPKQDNETLPVDFISLRVSFSFRRMTTALWTPSFSEARKIQKPCTQRPVARNRTFTLGRVI